MFRIHFDEHNNHFVIQVLRMGCLWRTVNGLEFATLDEARAHTKRIGLDVLYQDRSADAYRSYMANRHPNHFLEAA